MTTLFIAYLKNNERGRISSDEKKRNRQKR